MYIVQGIQQQYTYVLIDHKNITDWTKVVGLNIIRGVKNKKMYYAIMYLAISTIVYILSQQQLLYLIVISFPRSHIL